MGYAQLVIGPAGSGKSCRDHGNNNIVAASTVMDCNLLFTIERYGTVKCTCPNQPCRGKALLLLFLPRYAEQHMLALYPMSTYCSSLYEHCLAAKRTMHIVNLDPAAENFDYPVAMDIRELISLDDVMEELGLGPNGGLIYCMEHLEDSLDDWFDEELDNYLDDDYLVFDCPGQIELYSHVPVLKNFVEHLKRKNFNVCAVYLLDSQFMTDVTKFISGCMACLSAMVQLELPHVNILSKMDLVTNRKDVDEFLDPEPTFLLSELNQRMAPQFAKLNKSLIELVNNYSMVSFIPLDLRKEKSIQYVLAQIDNCIQYGEDADVKVKDFDPDEDDE